MFLWERRSNESAKAYEAAKLYFDMGAARSIEAVSRTLRKSKTLIDRWSRTHNWVERATHYDAHLSSIEQRIREEIFGQESERNWLKRREQQREREWQFAQALIARANEMLNHPLCRETITNEGVTIIEPTKWTISDAAKLIELADKLARLATGMDTERRRVNVKNLQELSDEDLGRLIDGQE